MKNTFLFLLVAGIMTITSCKKDPCSAIVCLNGGTCANGLCNCPTGYTGSDCGTQETPSSVTISQIVMTSFAATDNGAGWDLTTAPDVYLTLDLGTSATGNDFTTTTYYADATSSNSYTFGSSAGFPQTLNFPSSSYTIGTWDLDTPDADDLMGGIFFTPTAFDDDFPSTIDLSVGSFAYTLSVTWNF